MESNQAQSFRSLFSIKQLMTNYIKKNQSNKILKDEK